jgi:hypothetical protein
MRKTIILFLMVLSINIYPQINNYTCLDVEVSYHHPYPFSVDAVPLWITKNKIMVFYINEDADTIYSVKTTNRGLSWSHPVVQQIRQSGFKFAGLTAIKLESGRLILGWSILGDSMRLSISDDEGENWSQPLSLNGCGPTIFNQSNRFLKLSELDNNVVLLSYVGGDGQYSCFRKSYNGGLTWSDEDVFEFDQSDLRGIEQVSSDSLISIYLDRGIYSRWSTDGGISWGDSILIDSVKGLYNLPKVRMVKRENGSLILIYPLLQYLINHGVNGFDIFVKESNDGGRTWQNSYQITEYLGSDNCGDMAVYNDDVFVTFISERKPGIFYGVLGESIDGFTPPLLITTGRGEINFGDEEFEFYAEVVDDDGVKEVKAKMYETGVEINLYDDGLHNDSLANDNIYGNILPIESPADGGIAYAIDVNQITLPFNHEGILADVNVFSKSQKFQLEAEDIHQNFLIKETSVGIPIKGGGGSMAKYQEGSFLFSGGFWLSGYSNGTLWSNGVASATLVEDYVAGKVGADPQNSLNRIYVVSKNNTPYGYSWQNWKEAVSLGAEFYDGDRDGIYNPVDKNWNGTWDQNEDMPALIGDEIAWCVYNDGLPANQRRWESEPQGIEIRQTIFAANNPELENVVFIKYNILNTGTVSEILDSVYFGVWEDSDLGDHTDDKVGCDTLLNSGFYYNDEPDNSYGNNPPAFFSTLLQGPIVNTYNSVDTAKNNFGQQIGSQTFWDSKNLGITSHVFFIGGDPDLSDPNNAIQTRCYLEGKTRLCTIPNPCSFSYCEVLGGVNCAEVNPRFWASGDPVANVGWISRTAIDTRNLFSTGPFKLEKDKSQEIIIAYVIGRGNDPLNSITVARENVQRAIEEYESNFATMTYTPPAATNPVSSYVLYQNYPNPFNPNTTIRFELPEDGVVTIEVFDILGQKVKTILNEFKRADRYEVTFGSTGLASGIYIYQLRVNDYITSKKMVILK